jgi:hypothetical protein
MCAQIGSNVHGSGARSSAICWISPRMRSDASSTTRPATTPKMEELMGPTYR